MTSEVRRSGSGQPLRLSLGLLNALMLMQRVSGVELLPLELMQPHGHIDAATNLNRRGHTDAYTYAKEGRKHVPTTDC